MAALQGEAVWAGGEYRVALGLPGGQIGIHGGGALLVPIMVIGFGFAQHQAQGTSLAAILSTSATGALTHLREVNLDWRPVLLMGGIEAPLAAMFGLLARAINPGLLATVFGLFLLFAAFRLWPRQPRRPRPLSGSRAGNFGPGG